MRYKFILLLTIFLILVPITITILPGNAMTFIQADLQEQKLDQEAWAIAGRETNQVPDVVVKDDGGSPSIGMFQFKTATYEWMGEKFKLPHTDPQDYLEAREIYKAASKAGIAKDHWIICSQRILNI